MSQGWLPESAWRLVQSLVPIACVDIVCIQDAGAVPKTVGLIRRHTPYQGERWGLVGGRILLNESLTQAVERQLQITLGPTVHPIYAFGEEPHWVAQYRPNDGQGFLLDPRQHAIGLTYAVILQGRTEPRGEALDFRWFDLAELPSAAETAFGQDQVLRQVLKRVGGRMAAR